MYNKILLCGIQKAGNTWTQFVVFNYWNVKHYNATKTLTFDELQKIHLRRRQIRKDQGFNHKKDGFPEVHHTHLAYDGTGFIKKTPNTQKYFEKFDKLVYLYRNPFDVMISYHEFIFNRKKTPYLHNPNVNIRKIRSLKNFTKYYLEKWIHHVKVTKHRADVVLNYDVLRKHPMFFGRLVKLIDGTLDKAALKKAIEISSFENIKKMSIEVGKPYMRGGSEYKGYFCRDGRSGQYKEVMDKKLINYIKKKCKEEGINV